MNPDTAIFRDLLAGPSTSDSLAKALNLTVACVETTVTAAAAAGDIEIRTVDLGFTTYRLTPRKRQELTAPSP